MEKILSLLNTQNELIAVLAIFAVALFIFLVLLLIYTAIFSQDKEEKDMAKRLLVGIGCVIIFFVFLFALKDVEPQAEAGKWSWLHY